MQGTEACVVGAAGQKMVLGIAPQLGPAGMKKKGRGAWLVSAAMPCGMRSAALRPGAGRGGGEKWGQWRQKWGSDKKECSAAPVHGTLLQHGLRSAAAGRWRGNVATGWRQGLGPPPLPFNRTHAPDICSTLLRYGTASPLELGLQQHILVLLCGVLPAQVLLHAPLLQAPAAAGHRRERRGEAARAGGPELATGVCASQASGGLGCSTASRGGGRGSTPTPEAVPVLAEGVERVAQGVAEATGVGHLKGPACNVARGGHVRGRRAEEQGWGGRLAKREQSEQQAAGSRGQPLLTRAALLKGIEGLDGVAQAAHRVHNRHCRRGRWTSMRRQRQVESSEHMQAARARPRSHASARQAPPVP